MEYNSGAEGPYADDILNVMENPEYSQRKRREAGNLPQEDLITLRDRLFDYVEEIVDPRHRCMLILTPHSYIGARVSDLGHLKNHNSNEYKSYFQELIIPTEIKYIYRVRTHDSPRVDIEVGESEKNSLNFISILPEFPTYFGREGAYQYLHQIQPDLQSIDRLPPGQLVGSDSLFTLLDELKSAYQQATSNQAENCDLSSAPIASNYEAIVGLARTLRAAA